MPEMNGIQVLEYLQKNTPQTGAIMLSTLTHEGGGDDHESAGTGRF